MMWNTVGKILLFLAAAVVVCPVIALAFQGSLPAIVFVVVLLIALRILSRDKA